MSNNSANQAGYKNNKNSRSYKNHRKPCRGFPAIFFTCESGREKKCQREALELIHHYYYLSRSIPSGGIESDRKATSAEDADVSNNAPLSLDEELTMLRQGAAAEEVLCLERDSKRPRYETKGARSMKSPFTIHDVGMKGIICIVFTLPGSELIPYNGIIDALQPKTQDDGSRGDSQGGAANKTKGEENAWDPIETVRLIMKEVGGSNDAKEWENHDKGPSTHGNSKSEQVSTSPPGSRFISRMIPIQATCHASLNEIKAVTKALLSRFLNKKNHAVSESKGTTTFKIDFKRRNCSHLSRDQIFEALVPLVMGESDDSSSPNKKDEQNQIYRINLTDPDFAIRIEVCKTFCGVSILPRQKWYKNFNLAELVDPSTKVNET